MQNEKQAWIIICNSKLSMFIRIFGLKRKHSDNVLKLFPLSKYPQNSFTSAKLYLIFRNQVLVYSVLGRSINVKSAGLVGRHGPQSKQPFMVAFFKASEVLLRSVRAANKRKNQNRNKSSSHQDSSRVSSVGGKIKPVVHRELWGHMLQIK